MLRISIALLLAGAVLLSPAGAAEQWDNYTEEKGQLPGDRIQFLETDEDGNVWIGTLTGLGRFADGKFSVLTGPDGKAIRVQVWDVLRTGPGRWWVGAENGALLIDGGKVQRHLAGKSVAQVLPFGKDGLIAKVNDAVFTYDGADWKEMEFFRGKRPEILTPTSGGAVWVTVEANGVYVVDPADPQAAPAHHLRGTSVKVVHEDARKRIWCGMWGAGVMVLEKGQWRRHLAEEKSYVLHIRDDAAGNVWVATSAHGLFRYDGERWVNDLREEGSINMLETTPDGKVWISTQGQGGLRCWDGKSWQVSLDSVLPIRCLVRGPDGALWAGGVLDGVHVRKGK